MSKIVDKVIDRALNKLGPDVTKEDLEELIDKVTNKLLSTGLAIVAIHAICKALLQLIPQKRDVVIYLDQCDFEEITKP